jgi:hypothetical protein
MILTAKKNMIGYKKVDLCDRKGTTKREIIVKLLIPVGTLYFKGNRYFDYKNRAQKVVALDYFNLDGTPLDLKKGEIALSMATTNHTLPYLDESKFIDCIGYRTRYLKGYEILPDKFDKTETQCSNGIHLFFSLKRAAEY